MLHTDESLLPRRRAAWASWNFHLTDPPAERTALTYWMNNLQRLGSDTNFCVTLNLTDRIDPAKVIRTIHYSHPVFTPDGVAAQARHGEISGVEPHPLLRRLLALGLPRGRRGERAERARAAWACRERALAA